MKRWIWSFKVSFHLIGWNIYWKNLLFSSLSFHTTSPFPPFSSAFSALPLIFVYSALSTLPFLSSLLSSLIFFSALSLSPPLPHFSHSLLFHPSLLLQPSILLHPPSFSALLSFSILSPSPSSPHFPPSFLLRPLSFSAPFLLYTRHSLSAPPLSASPLSAFSALCTISAHCCCLWEYLDLYPPTVAVSGSTWIYNRPLLLFLGVPGSISPHC